MDERMCYSGSKKEHTCIINNDNSSGTFNAIMFDGAPTAKDYSRSPHEYKTYARGSARIHVFVYGKRMTDEAIKSLLRAWVNGTWAVVPLNKSTARKTAQRR